MVAIKPLATPETVTQPGCVYTLTHQAECVILDPRDPVAAAEVRRMKGFLRPDGSFQDYGDHEVSTLDAQGLADLLASTAGGKPAGDFRISDPAPAIDKRKAEIQAAEEAKKAPKKP